MKKYFLITSLICSLFAYAEEDLTKTRAWKNAKGQELTAALVNFHNNQVTMKRTSGKIVTFDLKLLSLPDQKLILKWAKINKGSNLSTIKKLKWRSRYSGDATPDIEYIGFKEDRNAHLYQTKYFDFYIEKKMTNSTVSKCVAVFDCIVGALNELPLMLDTVPKGNRKRYEAILVASAAQYAKLGGIPNSAGFFSPSRNLTVIPFHSLGIVKKGNNYVFDGKNTDFTTLIHELVHHSTSHWTSKPAWVSEGIADYMAAMPYRSGSFNYGSSPGKAIAADIRKLSKTTIAKAVFPNGVFHSYSPKHLFELERRTWNSMVSSGSPDGNRQYSSSMVLFYYFCHLDAGEGSNMLRYMHAHAADYNKRKIKGANDLKHVNKHLLRGRSYEELEQDIIQSMGKKGLRIKFIR